MILGVAKEKRKFPPLSYNTRIILLLRVISYVLLFWVGVRTHNNTHVVVSGSE
jgi:hypothetical protein